MNNLQEIIEKNTRKRDSKIRLIGLKLRHVKPRRSDGALRNEIRKLMEDVSLLNERIDTLNLIKIEENEIKESQKSDKKV